MNNYMTDEELLNFIADIEENELVNAPPQIEEKVFVSIDRHHQIVEYKKFRNRVIASVAAILIVISFVPERIKPMPEIVTHSWGDLLNSHFVSDLFYGREE